VDRPRTLSGAMLKSAASPPFLTLNKGLPHTASPAPFRLVSGSCLGLQTSPRIPDRTVPCPWRSIQESAGKLGIQSGSISSGQPVRGRSFHCSGIADPKTDRGQHCEAWFYVGMKKLLAGDESAAAECFKKCLATEERTFTEYQFSKGELKALGHT
jgi:hypothetical protein